MQQVQYESLVIQEPGTSDERTGHPQGGESEMSSHIQQGMDGREVKGREVWGNSYPQGAPLQQAPLGASTKPGSDHDSHPYISRFSIYTTVPPATEDRKSTRLNSSHMS